MVSGSQLQVAKLAQMCPAAPTSANQCFFRAHHSFYVLFKKNSGLMLTV